MSTPTPKTLALIGSKEGLAHIFLAFVDPGDYTLVPGCGYPVYHTGGILAGGKSYFMPMTEENDFLADFESTPPEVLAKTKMMILSYPNNPTGAIATPEYFDRAIAFAREHDLLILHDNAYSEIGFDGYVPISFMERPGAKDVAIELFSCSKAYNMTGWRVAFAVGNAAAIKALGYGQEQHRLGRLHRCSGRRDRSPPRSARLHRGADRAVPAPARHHRGWPREDRTRSAALQRHHFHVGQDT